MERQTPWSKLASIAKEWLKDQLKPPTPEQQAAISAGNQMFHDSLKGMLATPEEREARFNQLREDGINVGLAQIQFINMVNAQHNEVMLRH